MMRLNEVRISAGSVAFEGNLSLPDHAIALVLFAHGSGSSRHSPRNHFAARALNNSELATLLFDLLTPEEEAIDALTAELRFNIKLLTERFVYATNFAHRQQR